MVNSGFATTPIDWALEISAGLITEAQVSFRLSRA